MQALGRDFPRDLYYLLVSRCSVTGPVALTQFNEELAQEVPILGRHGVKIQHGLSCSILHLDL